MNPILELANTLLDIVENDQNYPVRYRLVFQALAQATALSYEAGVRIDPKEPGWPVVFITLPGAGQVSWHVPQYATEWDKHTTDEKNARVLLFCEALMAMGDGDE